MEANYNIVSVLPYTDMNPPWVYMCPHPESPSLLPPHPIPLGYPSAPAPSTLSHASNLEKQTYVGLAQQEVNHFTLTSSVVFNAFRTLCSPPSLTPKHCITPKGSTMPSEPLPVSLSSQALVNHWFVFCVHNLISSVPFI